METKQEPTSQRRRCAEHFICAGYDPALSCYDERVTTVPVAGIALLPPPPR